MWVDSRKSWLRGAQGQSFSVLSASLYRRWMPVCCVRFAPSTFMTSVQQWLDLVSSLEDLSCRFLRLLSRLPSCSGPPCPAFTLRRKLRFSPVTWCQGVLFQKACPNSSLTPCQATSINTPPTPSPPGNRYPACGVGLPGQSMRGQAQRPGECALPSFPQSLSCAALGSHSELGVAQGQVSLCRPGTPP